MSTRAPNRPKHKIPKARRHFLIAKSLLHKNRIKESKPHILNALQLDSQLGTDLLTLLYKKLIYTISDTSIRELIIEIYLHNKAVDIAIDELEELFDINPHIPNIYKTLWKLYPKYTNKLRIEALFEDAFSKHVESPILIDALSIIYQEKKEYQKCILLYKKLIQQTPTHIHYYKILASLYTKLHRFDDTAQVYKALIKTSPAIAAELIDLVTELSQKAPRSEPLRGLLSDLYSQTCQPEKLTHALYRYYKSFPDKTDIVIEKLHQASKAFPNNLDIHFALATLYYKNKCYIDSLSYLKKIFIIDSKQAPKIIRFLTPLLKKKSDLYYANSLMQDLYTLENRLYRALYFLNRCIILHPPSHEKHLSVLKKIHEAAPEKYRPIIYFLYANLEFMKGSFKSALSYLKKVPSLTLSKNTLMAQCYERLFHWEKAFSCLQNGLKRYPYNYRLHNSLHFLHKTYCQAMISRSQEGSDKGVLSLNLRHTEQAISYLQNISESQKNFFDSQILIAHCFIAQGRFDLSNNKIQQALSHKINPSNDSLNELRYIVGLNHINLGNLAHALHSFESIYAHKTDFKQIKTLLFELKEHSFIDLKGKALSGGLMAPESPFTLRRICITNIENKQSLKKPALSQPLSFAHTHNNQGVEQALRDTPTAAKESITLALQIDPKLTIAYCNLAYLNIEKGLLDEADHLLEKAINLNPNLDIIYLTQGINLFLKKNFRAARKSFDTCLHYNSKNTLIHLWIGDSYYQENNLKKAFSHWKKAQSFPENSHFFSTRTHYLKKPSHTLSQWRATI